MKIKLTVLIILSLLISLNLFAQSGSRKSQMKRGLTIIGLVKESNSMQPIEYANIVILKSADSSQVNGGVTNVDGEFKITGIRPGNYFAKVSFIGFGSETINDISLSRANRVLDLGIIFIESASHRFEDARVVGSRTPVEYKIDKKIINVSEQSTSISGSAVDVLENVPSVRVDIEGNVTLRGSGSFTLLIDGRPSVLDVNDALEQIPASSIDKIEIITNPSAKFDPEGVSGIINIISKENKLSGLSGIINGNIGLDDKYGADFTTTYRNKNYSLNFGADYNTRNFPGTSEEERRTYNDTLSSFLNSIGDNSRGRTGWGIKGGGDFNLSKNNFLGFSLRYGDRKSERTTEMEFHNYTEPATEEKKYISNSFRERSVRFFSSHINYKHTFGANQHELLAEAMFHKREKESEEITENRYTNIDGKLFSGRNGAEAGTGEKVRLKLDYTYPISEKSKIETGLQHETNNSEDDTKSFVYNLVTEKYDNEYSYIVAYKRNISSLYGIYSNEISNVGFQVGLRGERTFREINLVNSNLTTLIDRYDYFPTIHATYKINEIQQIMASYTSRIRRPRGWQFKPFDIWIDGNSLYRGNANLTPEYIDSYELAFMTNWGESLISLEGYYRVRNNKIERVRSVYEKNVTLFTYENVGTDFTFGTEVMINTDILKFWNVNLMSDLYHYKLEGSSNGVNFAKDNFNWSIRFNNTFQIFESTKLQINGLYNSPSISAQTEFEGFVMANIALRQEFFDKMLSLTLQVRDVFDTAIHKGFASGAGFETNYTFKRDAPTIMLNVSLKLNNHKEERKKRGSDSGDDMGNDEF